MRSSIPVLLSLAAVLFLFSGRLRAPEQIVPKISALSLDPNRPLIASQSGFAENAVYPSTTVPAFAGQLRRFGSWLSADESVGVAYSSWFPATQKFNMLVAGYPAGNGCELFIEAEETNRAIDTINVSQGANPGESWQTQTISFPERSRVTRFRIVAIDASSKQRGWVGFSEPFQFIQKDIAGTCKQLLLVVLTAAAALVALLFPGLWLRHRSLKPGCLPVRIPLDSTAGFSRLGNTGRSLLDRTRITGSPPHPSVGLGSGFCLCALSLLAVPYFHLYNYSGTARAAGNSCAHFAQHLQSCLFAGTRGRIVHRPDLPDP
jgi:hypothetical protein